MKHTLQGDTYVRLDVRMGEIKRQLAQDDGSPIDPKVVEGALDILQSLVDGKLDSRIVRQFKSAITGDGMSEEVFGLKIDRNNPGPFRYPLLSLLFKDGGTRNSLRWLIDVDGRIDLYLQGFDTLHRGDEEGEDLTKYATSLLQELLEKVKAAGYDIKAVQTYTGSFGASHILRNGALFRRLGRVDLPEPQVG